MLQQCEPGAIAWIERMFGDCIYNGRDLLGFCCGMASICCWLVAQMPQLYRNYKSQSAEALSPWFLAEWLLGDTFNLLGALLKGDQLPTVVFTAQYFICVDAVMMVQFLYYHSLHRRRERLLAARRQRHHRHHRSRHQHAHPHAQQQQQQHGHSSGDEQEAQGRNREGWGALAAAPAARAAAGAVAADSAASSSLAADVAGSSGRSVPVVAAGGRDVAFRPQRVLACLGTLLVLAHTQQQQQQPQLLAAPPLHRRLLMAAGALGGGGWSLAAHMPHWAYTAGTTLGYCSTVLYLTSRLSQIWKNYQRGSAEGLAISMFLTAIAANTFYGSSILIRSYTWPELRSSLPWLIGSLGTVALDGAIFVQWRKLGGSGGGVKDHPSDEESPLLDPDV